MNALAFDLDWMRLPGHTAPEIAATMGSLAIRVGDETVTRVHDEFAQAVRDRLIVSMYPLAEWMVAYWWNLLCECSTPGRDAELSSRHNMRHAGDGFAFPSLTLFREGAGIKLSWEQMRLRTQPLRFTESGARSIDAEEVSRALGRFVGKVVARLGAQGISGTWLQQEWAVIESLTEDEQAFCRAAARLGLDPFDVEDELADRIEALEEEFDAELLEDFLQSADPRQLAGHRDWVREGLRELQALAVSSRATELIRDLAVPTRSGPPWQQGYELARAVRDRLSLRDRAPLDLAEVVGGEVPVVEAEWSPPAMDALSWCADSGSPALYAARRRPESRRFLAARAVGAMLMDGDGPAHLLSAAATERQARTRAFAAELLAPADLLAEHLASDQVSADEVEDLADAFGVSTFVIQHQIANHNIATVLAPI